MFAIFRTLALVVVLFDFVLCAPAHLLKLCPKNNNNKPYLFIEVCEVLSVCPLELWGTVGGTHTHALSAKGERPFLAVAWDTRKCTVRRHYAGVLLFLWHSSKQTPPTFGDWLSTCLDYGHFNDNSVFCERIWVFLGALLVGMPIVYVRIKNFMKATIKLLLLCINIW